MTLRCDSPIILGMSERHLTYDDLVQLVELIKSASHFSEFRLKSGDIEVSLKRRTEGMPQRSVEAQAAPSAAATAAPMPAQAGKARDIHRDIPDGLVAVRAPMVGTFYHAPSPGAPPFVEVGQAVAPDTIIGIVEVMKLMNSIEAGEHGVVREFLVANAAPVEHGEALVLLEPKRP